MKEQFDYKEYGHVGYELKRLIEPFKANPIKPTKEQMELLQTIAKKLREPWDRTYNPYNIDWPAKTILETMAVLFGINNIDCRKPKNFEERFAKAKEIRKAKDEIARKNGELVSLTLGDVTYVNITKEEAENIVKDYRKTMKEYKKC